MVKYTSEIAVHAPVFDTLSFPILVVHWELEYVASTPTPEPHEVTLQCCEPHWKQEFKLVTVKSEVPEQGRLE